MRAGRKQVPLPKTRSGFEAKALNILRMCNGKFEYEPKEGKLKYTIPESRHTYLPDIVLDNGIHVETKGRMATAQDRQKYLHIIRDNPGVDLRFVFQRPGLPIYKGSKTTYAKWADKNGIRWGTLADLPAWAKEGKK